MSMNTKLPINNKKIVKYNIIYNTIHKIKKYIHFFFVYTLFFFNTLIHVLLNDHIIQ